VPRPSGSTGAVRPPDLPWNGRLALVGVGPDGGRSADAEIAALAARGYACADLAPGAAAAAATVERARRELVAAHGREPDRIVAFAYGAATRDALELIAARPHALHGAVCVGLAAGLAALDLTEFAAEGGRLILVHGERDADVPIRDAVAVLEAFESQVGGAVKAAGAMRLFIVPEADRTLGGARLELVEALERWLEWTPRRPPDVLLLLRERSDGAEPSSRPLYPYPLRSVFKGRGDPAHWKSWYAPAIYRRTAEPPAPDELCMPLPQDPARHANVEVRPGVGPVLVVGATGRLGLELVNALRARSVAVRAAVRDPAKAAKLLPPDVEVAVVDVRDSHAIERAMRGVRDVIFAASATAGGDGANTPAAVEHDGALACIAAAATERVAHFVLISSAASTQPEHVHNLWGAILTWKQRSEAALRASGVPYTVLRPLGLRPAPGHVPYAGRTRGIRFAQGDRIAFGEEIHREDVAALCVALLEHPDAIGTTFEAFNDDTLPPDSWPETFGVLRKD
jgi:uncharacterized protein YbjT (DUF2867 family)